MHAFTILGKIGVATEIILILKQKPLHTTWGVGLITSRCSGKEPALLPRHEKAAEIVATWGEKSESDASRMN